MQQRSGRSRLAPVLAALPLALVAAMAGQRAHAAGFQLQENDAQGMGRAYAGAGAAPGDCSVVENNPAEDRRTLYVQDGEPGDIHIFSGKVVSCVKAARLVCEKIEGASAVA